MCVCVCLCVCVCVCMCVCVHLCVCVCVCVCDVCIIEQTFVTCKFQVGFQKRIDRSHLANWPVLPNVIGQFEMHLFQYCIFWTANLKFTVCIPKEQ